MNIRRVLLVSLLVGSQPVNAADAPQGKGSPAGPGNADALFIVEHSHSDLAWNGSIPEENAGSKERILAGMK